MNLLNLRKKNPKTKKIKKKLLNQQRFCLTNFIKSNS